MTSDSDRRWAGPGGRIAVTVVLVGAGLLAATSAHGRSPEGVTATTHSSIADLVAAQERAQSDGTARQELLEQQVQAGTRGAAAIDARVRATQLSGAALEAPAGLLPLAGPGYTVSLDDAPRGAPVEIGYPKPTADDLVVHQQDVQAVVNALWAGGASGITIMGRRLIATSAVKCVGNTLLLEGRVYSPPFVVTAVGDPTTLAAAVNAAPAVVIYRQYVAVYGLRFHAGPVGTVTLPGYDGAVSLTGVTAIPAATAGAR